MPRCKGPPLSIFRYELHGGRGALLHRGGRVPLLKICSTLGKNGHFVRKLCIEAGGFSPPSDMNYLVLRTCRFLPTLFFKALRCLNSWNCVGTLFPLYTAFNCFYPILICLIALFASPFSLFVFKIDETCGTDRRLTSGATGFSNFQPFPLPGHP